MALRESSFGEIKAPQKWSAGLALAAAAFAALILAFGLGGRRAGHEPARRLADSVAAPVGGVVSAPVRWTGEGFGAIGDYLFAGSQNRRLKAELVQARRWRDVALALAAENARYRALMGVKTDPPIPMVFARTVLDARGPFANTRLADAGSDRGVIEGAPVLAERGLVGRVVGVAPAASRILLLTDAESRVPVMTPRTNARAILVGDGGPAPRLDYLRSHDPLRPGDIVMTSGDGGVFPRGLPVGVVMRGGPAWRVALAADATPIDFVQILLFRDFSQLIAPATLTPRTLPSSMTEESKATILGTAAGAPTAAPKPRPAAAPPDQPAAARAAVGAP